MPGAFLLSYGQEIFCFVPFGKKSIALRAEISLALRAGNSRLRRGQEI